MQRFWDDHGRERFFGLRLQLTVPDPDEKSSSLACSVFVDTPVPFNTLTLVWWISMSANSWLLAGDSSYSLSCAAGRGSKLRHFPIEELYDSSICVVSDTDAYEGLSGWVVATDVSSGAHLGGYAVVIQPPCSLQVLIRRGHIPARCTNTKAELIALQVACDMIRILLPHLHEDQEITLLTDSQFCLQLMHGAFLSSSNALQVSGLMSSWSRVADRTALRHVKSHAGQYHNELADTQAKLALLDPTRRQVTFMQDRPDIDIPSEEAWLRRMRTFLPGNL